MGRTERVVAQTRSRLAGVMPESATRLVSLHDLDARPIRKGRLGKPVEFGYKAQVVDNADGVILDHNVEIGNPLDAPQLAPAIERITRRTGRAPRAVTADRGYGDASVERDLHELGVRQRGDPAQKQTQRRPPRVRTPASVPRQGQMAHRIRRPDQPPQTQLRLEPHRTHRHRPAPEPGADTASSPTTSSRSAPSQHEHRHHDQALNQFPARRSHHSPPSRLRTVFQVEVANRSLTPSTGGQFEYSAHRCPVLIVIRTAAGPSNAVQCVLSGGPYTVWSHMRQAQVVWPKQAW